MAKLPEKIEDWTPPWEKNGEEFDAEMATTLIFSLEKAGEKLKADKSTALREKREVEDELAGAKSKLSAKPGDESAKDSRITELSNELDALRKDGRPDDAKLIEKYEVALEVGGLSLRDAKRLVGDDRDELAEDAADLAARFSGGSENNGQENEKPQGPPTRAVTPSGQLNNGRKRVDEQPAVKSVEELMKEAATPSGLVLSPLNH